MLVIIIIILFTGADFIIGYEISWKVVFLNGMYRIELCSLFIHTFCGNAWKNSLIMKLTTY